MKKLLASLAILTMSGSVVSPIITTIINNTKSNKNNSKNNNTYNTYVPCQAQTAWENYMKTNQEFINFIKHATNLGDDYVYQKSNIKLSMLKDDKGQDTSQPIGTLLMNGKIQTTSGSPTMASQHIIDNSQGSNPITVNYDSKTITDTTTISASISEGFSMSTTVKAELGIPFDNVDVSTTLSFNMDVSLSATSSVEENITFDKFSTTVKPGDIEEVDYIVMQNKQVFNMLLKTQLDIPNCSFEFVNKNDDKDIKTIAWTDLTKNIEINQLFSKSLSNSLSPSDITKNMQSFLSVDKVNDPTVPIDSQYYNPDVMFIYLPLSFTVDGTSTLITQSKITK